MQYTHIWGDIHIYGPVATRLLQRAFWRGTEVSPRPVVWCLTGCCTFDPASPSLGQCDWSNSHWGSIGWTFRRELRLSCACLPTDVSTGLLHPISPVSSHRSVQSLDVRNFVLRRRVCYLCRGHTLWQLVRGLSPYPPPLLGTDFRWIFVIPVIVFSLSGKNWRLICSMRLFNQSVNFFN